MKTWKTLLMTALLTAFVGGLVGCNTVEGAGEDIEAGGEAISDTSRDIRD